MVRSTRKVVAWLGLGMLLFMQLAVAAYACAAALQADGVPTATSNAVPLHQPCEHRDQQPSKLCEQHCLQAAQSVDTQPPGAAIAPVLPLIGVVRQAGFNFHARQDGHGACLAGAVGPPPLVRFGVLRI